MTSNTEWPGLDKRNPERHFDLMGQFEEHPERHLEDDSQIDVWDVDIGIGKGLLARHVATPIVEPQSDNILV